MRLTIMTTGVAALAAALVGCGGGGPSGASMGGPPLVPVEVVTLAPETIRDVVEFVGQLDPEESVDVKAEIPGVIDEILFTEGARVKKGQVLFRLRDAAQRASAREAEARERLAADVLRRLERLREEGVASEAEGERAAHEADAARAALQRTHVEVARTEIRAPFDGVLGARRVSPGDRIDENATLVTLQAADRLKLAFAIPEVGVQLARVGMPFTVTVKQFPGETFPGEVYFVAPGLDPASRRLLVKGWIPNPDGRLRAGVFATVQVEIARHEGALVVPDSAIVYQAAGGMLVWRAGEGGAVESVPVELGIRQNGRIEITRGLHSGDVVVSAGTNKIFPGARIQAVTATAGGAADATSS